MRVCVCWYTGNKLDETAFSMSNGSFPNTIEKIFVIKGQKLTRSRSETVTNLKLIRSRSETVCFAAGSGKFLSFLFKIFSQLCF